MFKIESTESFNADRLVNGNEYDYITRTSVNQGIMKTTGFINSENINPSGIWSLGLLQMTFFYREKSWYAGQFVRKIIPKISIPKNAVLYFTTVLNMCKSKLLSVLVRNVDETFKETSVKLPIKSNGKIDFDFMENFIAELKEERLAELRAYLKVCGLDNYELTNEEKEVIQEFDNLEFAKCDLISVFDVKNTSNILSDDIIKNSGTVPYLCASSINNAVNSYISYDNRFLERGNCIFIGGKTFIVSYQEKDFFSNDSHNLALYLKNYKRTKYNQLYLVTCLYKSLNSKYSWGNSISKKKIMSDKIYLPVKNGKIDYETMDRFISAVQKLVIKDVVLYADREIEATEKIINNN